MLIIPEIIYLLYEGSLSKTQFILHYQELLNFQQMFKLLPALNTSEDRLNLFIRFLIVSI